MMSSALSWSTDSLLGSAKELICEEQVVKATHSTEVHTTVIELVNKWQDTTARTN